MLVDLWIRIRIHLDSFMLVEKATEATKITCWNPVQPGGESNCMKKEITR